MSIFLSSVSIRDWFNYSDIIDDDSTFWHWTANRFGITIVYNLDCQIFTPTIFTIFMTTVQTNDILCKRIELFRNHKNNRVSENLLLSEIPWNKLSMWFWSKDLGWIVETCKMDSRHELAQWTHHNPDLLVDLIAPPYSILYGPAKYERLFLESEYWKWNGIQRNYIRNIWNLN